MIKIQHWLVYLAIYLLSVLQPNWAPELGVVLGLYFLIVLVDQLGKKIPVKECVLATLGLQCLVSPYAFYNFIDTPVIQQMAVSQELYYAFLTPAFALFGAGLMLFVEGSYRIEKRDKYYTIGKNLILIGVVADLLLPLMPNALLFFVTLISYFKFVGVFNILFSNGKSKKTWIAIAFAGLLIASLAEGVFQSVLGWAMFLTMYILLLYQLSFGKKLALISVMMVGVYVLQDTKQEYRGMLLRNKAGEAGAMNRSQVFLDTYMNSFGKDDTFDEEAISMNFVRFNQGYIISRIMHNVPLNEPYANGETIYQAIRSAFIPRIFDSDKATVGGKNGLYTRFTGFVLEGGTSMDLSMMGEIYANYGKERGIFASLLLGLLYNLMITLAFRAAKKDAQIIFWFPYIFLIMVRPENAFVPVFNHIAKAMIVFFLIYRIYLIKWIGRDFYRIELTSRLPWAGN